MKVMETVLWTALAAGAWSVGGCDVFLGERSRPDRVLVQQEPQYVIVQQAPPPLIMERHPARPSNAHIWIDGSWNWDSRQYRWEAGRYAVPPQAGAVWVGPRYERDPKGYRYSPGQWRNQNQGNDRGNDRGNNRGHERDRN